MKRRRKIREEIVKEYLVGEASFRELATKYGIGASTLNRWVKAAVRKAGQEEKEKPSIRERASGRELIEGDLAAEVVRLREELETSELHNKLLNAMIDIAEEQFEIPIRKKSGARQ